MKQSALLEFESSAFADELGEDRHTNPGVFGKALAQWLAQQLRAKGLGVGEVIAEDFGWCVPVESIPHLYVACASADDEMNRWRVFVFAEEGLMDRLLGRGQSTQSVASLCARLKEVLQSAQNVQGLREESP
jgi:hypothetical protein